MTQDDETEARNPEDELARENLIKFRVESGLTQSQAAEMAGLAVNTIASYESGRRGLPKMSTTKRLMDIFGRRLGDIYEVNPPPINLAAVKPYSLRILPHVEVPADITARLRAAIDEANQEYQRLKASGQLAKKDGGDGGE